MPLRSLQMAGEPKSSFAFVDSQGTKVEASRYLNPDGNLGGWVAINAKVGRGAVIEPGAFVEPRAVVAPGRHIKRGERVPEPSA